MTEGTFKDGPPVPVMVEGTVDAGTLGQLFQDLSQWALIESVREKGLPESYSSDQTVGLDTARNRLLSGIARAVQIRYRYEDRLWTDTIITVPGGFRTIRCRHEDEPTPG